jgi:basic amino acid/polyamine antiporter, APA family
MSVSSPFHVVSRRLTIWTAISVVIGCVIGSGVFVKPGRVLVAAGTSNGALLAWLLGGLLSLAGGLTIAEIAFRIPKTGGVYVYVEELFGKPMGFICGWVQSLIYGPALMSALSLYFASLFAQFFGLDATATVKPIAFIAMFFLCTVTAYSTAYGAFVQNLTTIVKLIPIAVLGVAGLFMGGESIFGMSVANADGTAAAGLGVAVLSTLWAYDGWMQVANLAGELENPAKNLPRAIVLGLSGVMVAYILVNLSLFHVVPVSEIAVLNEKTAAVAAVSLFGEHAGKLLSLGILVSIFGCLNGNILTMTRVPYAMATRRAFPFHGFFATLHPKFQTPINSILLKSFCASIMILLLNPDRITDLAMFIMYLFYAAVFVGVIKLRKQYGVPEKGSYRVPLYPVIPIMACLGSVYICYSMAVQAPLDAFVALAIAASGYPVYLAIRKQGMPV